MGFAKTVSVFSSVVVLAAALALYLHPLPVPMFPQREVEQMVTSYYGSDLSGAGYVGCPMCGRVVIVTGSTSGLGQSIAKQMYKVSFSLRNFLCDGFCVAVVNHRCISLILYRSTYLRLQCNIEHIQR
jgi:hypothetical protein